MERILVTGATGQVGTAVVETLVTRGIFVRAAARRVSTISGTEHIEPVAFDYNDPGTYQRVLSDITGIFLVVPPLDPKAHRKLMPFIDRAKESGVRHIVFNSVFGFNPGDEGPLQLIERHLLGSGMGCTILRPNFFMENFTTGFIGTLAAGGEISLAADNGKTSFISVKDIAEAAARSFQEKRYGAEYDLSGPEALDYAEVARIISNFSGREITYRPISENTMMQRARQSRWPEEAVRYLADLYAAVRAGVMAEVTDGVRRATGRSPISFKDFARKNASYWRMEKAA